MSGSEPHNDHVSEFLGSFDESRFPEDFLQAYDIRECLSQSEYGETFLAADRESGGYVIAKCYPRAVLPHIQEHELLKKLQHRDLPAYIGTYENDGMLCVLREYVIGTPLSEALRERSFTPEQAVRLGISLLDILQYLHAQAPPVIHRDIKPENIILREDGSVALIDFGISRAYREGADTDTMNFGTKRFSAPEQYGYAQTDSRSDLFSLGMVLGYLLTGSTRTDAYHDIRDRRLARVIETCTAFDPARRYRSAADCRRALCALLPARRRRRRLAVCAAALAAIAAIVSGVVFLPGALKRPAPRFTEPMMEQAVRAVLGKSETDTLSHEDLLAVEGLYVFGNTVSETQDGFYAAAGDWYAAGMTPKGGIASLADVKLLPNLRVLCVAAQGISDISPLKELPLLEKAELKHNRIGDISALSGLAHLASVGLNDNPVTDMSPLAQCKSLRFLDLCDVQGYDPSFLGELGDFEFLDIANRTDSYLYLGSRHIRDLKLGYTYLDSLAPLSEVTGLASLDVKHSNLTSLAGIEAHRDLSYLNIAGCAIDDLSLIVTLPGLTTLVVSPEQLSAAEALHINGLTIQTE